MPATSAKQKKFMDAAAHNPAFAKKVGVPVKVAKEFSKASKGQTFKEGDEMKESKGMMKKEVGFMKAKGAPKSMLKHEMAEMKGMKSGGKAYAAGGNVTKMGAVKTAKPTAGSASSRADGIAQKGKTKGKMLNKGGKC